MKEAKEQAYEKIARLIERFSEHVEEYKRNNYNEHQTRVDYINPFFKALGWDMDNEQGYAEAYREVIHEDKVKVGSSTKAPDYGFTLFGQRKFFVDAKKPAVNIKSEIAPAYQVRRYGWSAKVPISIVTDFEEFSIYDCTKKPKPTDKASVARIKYITYDQYLDEFDFLWDVFAKENLPKGRFDKYVQSDTRRKGTASVDDEFLKSIEQWRTYLATTIALRNKSLDEDEINYAVQKIIDRIIFLRMCEDRGVEQYGELKKAAEKGEIYQNLFALYRMADDKYNSGLFDFEEDKITPTLTVDNKVMKNIIKELYYPNCEYEFSVMPADILGSVYEQFLGKTIRLTKAHHAKIEEKPEVRKAGGVYYTPKYVVDYIVENTVGKLIEGKTPKQIEKIKICDPACGSGSFLIGAYQFLLDWHLKYYTNNPSPKKKDKLLTPDGNLTTSEKKRILLNNIFGVDIDTQAVEVTKLNLLLKALEGETQSSINQQLSLFHERVLPNLHQNIKCGNSLIGNDFYDIQLDLFPDQMKKVNAFDWKEGFPEIFKQGGFDAVIGNPPWGAVFCENELEYLRGKHHEIIVRMIDSFMYFIHKGSKLLNKYGTLGFIVPDVILYQEDNKNLRNYLLKYSKLRVIINSGDVFEGVKRPSSIVIFDNGIQRNNSIKIADISKVKKHEKHNILGDKSIFSSVFQRQLSEIPNCLFVTSNPEQYTILSKLESVPTKKLVEFVDDDGIQRGVSPDLKVAFLVDQATITKYKLEDVKLKPVLQGGREVKRYDIIPKNSNLIYTSRYDDFAKLPNICKYIDQFKEKITCREVQQKKHPIYALHRPRKEHIFLKSSKILGVITEDEIIVAPDDKQYYATDGLYLFGLKENVNMNYIMGVLNSTLFIFVYRLLAMEKGRMLAQVKPTLLNKLPIPLIDFEHNKEKQTHDNIVKYVGNILKLKEQIKETNLETQQQQIQRTINHAEKKIDELVYELYGLSEDEIEIIENS